VSFLKPPATVFLELRPRRSADTGRLPSPKSLCASVLLTSEVRSSANFVMTEISEVAPDLVTFHTRHVDQLKAGPKGPAPSWKGVVHKAMYAVVRRFEGVRDSQKVAQVAKEGFVPVISEMPGFVAYYLVDAGDGVTVATSVFEHKDAEEQSTFVAGEFVAEHLAPLMPNPPQVTAGEVVAYKAKSS
jgi:hypothetical protein